MDKSPVSPPQAAVILGLLAFVYKLVERGMSAEQIAALLVAIGGALVYLAASSNRPNGGGGSAVPA